MKENQPPGLEFVFSRLRSSRDNQMGANLSLSVLNSPNAWALLQERAEVCPPKILSVHDSLSSQEATEDLGLRSWTGIFLDVEAVKSWVQAQSILYPVIP